MIVYIKGTKNIQPQNCGQFEKEEEKTLAVNVHWLVGFFVIMLNDEAKCKKSFEIVLKLHTKHLYRTAY